MNRPSYVIVLLFLLTASAFVSLAPALAEKSIYGCQDYPDDVIHCDLMMAPMNGYEVIGNSTLIHPLTRSEPLFVPGKVGGAIELRAQYRESIEITNTDDLSPKAFSVSFWIKPTIIEPYGHIVSHTNKAQTSGWMFDEFSVQAQDGGGTSSVRFGIVNSNGTVFAPKEIVINDDNDFTLITGTFDGSTVRIYKDGAQVGAVPFSGNYTADPGVPLRIGSAAYCSSCNRWSGVIDDVRMFNTALSGQDVSDIYNLNEVPDGIGHWKFDSDTHDSVGSNDGSSTTLLTSMVFTPDGRLLYSEKNTGEIRVMSPDFKLQDEPFASINDVYASWEQGMLGLAVDPEFEQNHYVYLYYSALDSSGPESEDKVVNRLVRFTDQQSKGIDMKVLIDNIPASRGFHSGGALAFGADGKLYITVGDATEHIFAQDPSIPIGKVLRINKDGTIPSDNPYQGLPVFTLGHRNMFGIAFDNDGTGMVTENGDYHYDELNVIVKGGNYGFPTLQPPNLPPERANNSAIKPLRSYWDAIAPTQMIYYTGNAIPELQNKFLFGSFTGDLYAVELSGNKTSIDTEYKIELGHFPFVPTIAVAQSPDGKIYYGAYQIFRLNSISDKHDNVHQIFIDRPSSVNVTDLQFDSEKRITIDTTIAKSDANNFLTLQVPKRVLENITAVTVENTAQNAKLEYSVNDSGASVDTIRISLSGQSEGSHRIVIAGGVAMPEFPTAAALVGASAVLVIPLVLIGRKRF